MSVPDDEQCLDKIEGAFKTIDTKESENVLRITCQK